MAATDRNNPLMPGGRPEVYRPLFLRILRNSGVIREAAEASGLTPYQVRAAMRRDEGFAALVNDALEDATDLLEIEMRRRALAGSDLLMMFALKKMRPEYRDRVLPNNITQVNVKAYVGFTPDDWDKSKDQDLLTVDSTAVLSDSDTLGTTEPDLSIQAPALADKSSP